MKQMNAACIVTFLIAPVFAKAVAQDTFPMLRGPYLGQKAPGMTPEVFAPGVISMPDSAEAGSAFTPDALVYLFNKDYPPKPGVEQIHITELRNGVWIKPYRAPFSSDYDEWDFSFAPDGRAFYYTSRRPLHKGLKPARPGNIWVTQRTSSGWAEPRALEYPVNTTRSHDAYPSVTLDGTLYFFSNRPGGLGGCDIYRAEPHDGRYNRVENLGEPINTEYDETDLCISPDESYLIFASRRPGGYGDVDLYVAFKTKSGSWTEPRNLGKSVNWDSAVRPYVTPDGRFLFFHSNRKVGKGDIYWVDTGIIEKLRPNPQ